MLFNSLSFRFFLSMLLLAFLLFVTAAVLVDKPEPLLHENGFYDHHIMDEKGTEKVITDSVGDLNSHVSADHPKDIIRGHKLLFFQSHLDKADDLTDVNKDQNSKTYMDRAGHRLGREDTGKPLNVIKSPDTIVNFLFNEFPDDEKFDREESRVKRGVSDDATKVSDNPEATGENMNNELSTTDIIEGGSENSVNTEDKADVVGGIKTNNISLRKEIKRNKRLFDPWVFDREIGQDPNNCFSRLSLTKSAIEDYALVTDSESRLSSLRIPVIDTNFTRPRNDDHNVYRRSMDDATVPEDVDFSDIAVEEGHAAPMLMSPEMIPDCHFLLPYNRQWIKLVSSCPSTWHNATVEYMCVPQYQNMEDDSTIDLLTLPVQDGRGIVYRNIFCAECNRAANAKAWDVVVLCNGTSSLLFFDGNVIMTIMPKLAAARNCIKTLWPRQPEKVETCLITKRRAPYHHTSHDRRYQEEMVTYPVAFTVLMNFGFDGKTHILFRTSQEELTSEGDSHVCSQPNQVYDSNNKLCRTLVCPAGYKLVGEECLVDDISETVDNTDESLPNVQTLTHLPDLAVITLTVNATDSNLVAINSSAFKAIMVEGIATLFNISSERIQNFTIDVANSTEPGPEVAVHTLNEHPVMEPGGVLLGSKTNNVDFPSEEGSPRVSADAKPRTIQTDGQVSTTSSSDIRHNQSSSLKTNNDSDSGGYVKGKQLLSKVGPEADVQQIQRKKDDKTYKTKSGKKIERSNLDGPNETNLTSTEKTTTLRFRFILLPARSSRLYEGTVSSIKEQMNKLFKEKKFTMSLNGTEVTVVDMQDKADQESTSTFCSKGKMQFYFADQLDIINAQDSSGHTVTHIMVNSTNRIYGPGKYDLTLWLSGNVGSDTNVTDVMGYAFVCVMPKISHRNCLRIKLKQQEYTLLANMSISWGKKLYNMTEYEFLDETSGIIEICVPESILHHQANESSYIVIHGCQEGFEGVITAGVYMTDILGRISIVALAIVLMTYCLFPKLRNLPGVNTMNLTLALLIGESIFITLEKSIYAAWLCSLVAILLHYFFLASFFWMNVMSYDVFRTFANPTFVLPHIREKSKYLCKYMLYCWGSPAIIVCTCVVLDFTKIIPNVEIGYGSHAFSEDITNEGNVTNNTYDYSNYTNDDEAYSMSGSPGCWIENPIAALTAFGAPIVIIFLINICLFVRTILCIQKTAKFTTDHTRRSSVNRRTGRNDVMLYIRMSTVMGFTWVFGLASSLISAIFSPPSTVVCYVEHVIGSLFIIFNCSQGLFIFFAFVFKRRVFYLYKGLWIRICKRMKDHQFTKRQRHTSASTSTSSSSSSSSSSATTSISTIS